MDHATAAQQLSALLSLQHPPVALALADQPPDGIAPAGKAVPSACTFWRQAEQGTFYASAAQHFNCPVGSMVMGFELPAEVGEQLGGLVQSMCDARYLSMDEAAKIPTVDHHSAVRRASTTSRTATRRRSRTGCRTWPRSRARSRRCACPPGSGG